MRIIIIGLILMLNINAASAELTADKRIKLLKRLTREIKNKQLKRAFKYQLEKLDLEINHAEILLDGQITVTGR